jgi:TolB-like protein
VEERSQYIKRLLAEDFDKLDLKVRRVIEALDELDRILASEEFKGVHPQTRDLLRYLVLRELLGQQHRLKQKHLAIHVFQKPNTFNPKENGIVRQAAAQLRDRLKRYYNTKGKRNRFQISIPDRGYVPEIVDRSVSIGITRFDNWNPGGTDNLLCALIQEEIVHELAKAGVIRVAAEPSLKTLPADLHFSLRGSLETLDDDLRVNVSLSDLQVRRVRAAATYKERRENVINLARRIATDIAAELMPPAHKPASRSRRTGPRKTIARPHIRARIAARET